MRNLVWLPLFGVWFIKYNSLIVSYVPWLQYQTLSMILFVATIFKIFL